MNRIDFIPATRVRLLTGASDLVRGMSGVEITLNTLRTGAASSNTITCALRQRQYGFLRTGD